MPISSLSLLEGATITPTGGSALAFKPMFNPQGGSVKVTCSTDTDLRTRRTIDVSVKEPKVSVGAPNGYTQARVASYAKVPFTLDNGSVTTCTVKCELAYDSEMTQAEILELRKLGAQIFIDGDMDDTYYLLSLD